jgi:hypothetical protein
VRENKKKKGIKGIKDDPQKERERERERSQ